MCSEDGSTSFSKAQATHIVNKNDGNNNNNNITNNTTTDDDDALDMNKTTTTKKSTRKISFTELSSHKSADDCWISINGNVYDVSNFHKKHPGGPVIMQYVGMESGDQFALFHTPTVEKLHLRRFLIGTLSLNDDEPSPSPDPVEDHPVASHHAGESLPCSVEYRRLREDLWNEGAFEPSYPFFFFKMILATSFLLLATLLLSLYPDDTLLLYLLSPLLVALTLQQWALIAHDTLHNGVVLPRGRNLQRSLLGHLSGGVFMGVSFHMWLREHSEHHAYTIRPGMDPQFDYLFLWLMSEKEWPYWMRHVPEGPRWVRRLVVGFAKMMIRIQHATIVPLAVIVGRYNFLALCWSYAIKNGHWDDLISMSCHFAWYSLFVNHFYRDSWRSKMLFVVVNYAFSGMLHVQLLLSHFCGPQFSPSEEASLGTFQFQLLTTRNVKTAWWDRWFHGGLDLQIEHHLFPMLPRHRLYDVRPRVMEIANKHGIEYKEVSFGEGVYEWLVQKPYETAKIIATADFI